MLHGDISNRTSPYIAFDIDSLLFVDKEDQSIWDRFKLLFVSAKKQYMGRDYNLAFTNYIRKLYRETDYNIVFLTSELEEDELSDLAEKLDSDFVPFSRLYSYEKVETLRTFCDNLFMYFFSSNEELLSTISCQNALPFDRVREVLGV